MVEIEWVMGQDWSEDEVAEFMSKMSGEDFDAALKQKTNEHIAEAQGVTGDVSISEDLSKMREERRKRNFQHFADQFDSTKRGYAYRARELALKNKVDEDIQQRLRSMFESHELRTLIGLTEIDNFEFSTASNSQEQRNMKNKDYTVHKRYLNVDDDADWPLEYVKYDTFETITQMNDEFQRTETANLEIMCREAGYGQSERVPVHDRSYVHLEDFDDNRYAWIADQLGYTVVEEDSKEFVNTKQYRDGVAHDPAFDQ